jgi:hypothetical protein
MTNENFANLEKKVLFIQSSSALFFFPFINFVLRKYTTTVLVRSIYAQFLK